MLLFRIGWLTLVCWLAAIDRGFSADQPPIPEEITVRSNLRYREGPSKAWQLDLAMPKDRRGQPRPAIVVIHGGGWLEGDKSSFASRTYGVPGNIVDLAALG